METPTRVLFDPPKLTWGDGPWQHEPDRVDFHHAGLPCLLLRNRVGVWCGYAAVPPGHPWYGVSASALDADVDVHGGLNYAAACEDPICHVPAPGESDAVWWFGFDTGHAFDYCPGLAAKLRELGHQRPFPSVPWLEDKYRDLAYVRREVERLAEHLARASEAV